MVSSGVYWYKHILEVNDCGCGWKKKGERFAMVVFGGIVGTLFSLKNLVISSLVASTGSVIH